MVAIIKTGNSIRRTVHYNENKVIEGVADLLVAENYPVDGYLLSSEQRISLLQRVAATNPNVTRNSVHISLNFAPGEKIEEGTLIAIANEYMEMIGFGKQPYLVYQHHDAGHPHIHIATTKVQHNGRAIRMQNIGKKLSEPARIQIEKKYGLIRAEDHKKGLFKLPPANNEKAIYGKKETRRIISNILFNVLEIYKYTSLTELNAVLNVYNVHADRGSENSRSYKHGGLYYKILSPVGRFVSIPLKASLFHQRPTLEYLEKRFLLNHAARKPHAKRVTNAINIALHGKQKFTLKNLQKALLKSGIKLIARTNKEGRLYGVTFVDFTTKCVFNGSDLGKEYSSNALNGRLDKPVIKPTSPTIEPVPATITGNEAGNIETPSQSLLDTLMEYEQGADYIPPHLRLGRKRKKKKNRNNPEQ